MLLGLAALGPGAPAGARDDLSGTWREEYEEVVVSLDQWSAACGEAPRTTGRRVRGLEFEVEDRGVELVFRGAGGTRFSSVDCQTANPAVKPKERTLQDTLFLISCSTPEDAPSYENGLYSFRVHGKDRLEYRETTRYAKNAQGAQCASTRRARRMYTRLASTPRPAAPDAGTAQAGERPKQEDFSKGEDGGQGLEAGTVADARQEPDAGAIPGADPGAGEAILGHKLPKPPLPRPPSKTPVVRGEPAPADEPPAQPEAVDAGPPAEAAQPAAARPVPVEPEPSAPPPPLPRREPSPEVSSEDGWILWAGLGGGLAVLGIVVGILLLSRKPRWQPPPAAQVSRTPVPPEPSPPEPSPPEPSPSEPAPSAPPPPAPEPPVFCTGCGARLPATARFCPHCATRVR